MMAADIKAGVCPEGGTLALVEQAQAAYDAGRDREWAGALWMAGEGAVRELAKARGIAADGDIVAVLERLDEQDDTGRGDYYGRELGGLLMLRTHYQLGALESYWWEDLHNDIVAFIAECHAGSGRDGGAAIRGLRCSISARAEEVSEMTTDPKAAVHLETGILALVKQAQAAYDAGRDREWAGALWMAGEGAVRELAKVRGIAAEGSIVAVLKQLDEQDEKGRGRFYSRELGGLTMLEIHYQRGVLESYWWEDLHNDITAFITECHAATT